MADTKQAVEFWVELTSGRYPVRQVKGNEQLSGIARYEICVQLEDDGNVTLHPYELCRTEAILEIRREGVMRRLVGLVTEARLEATGVGNVDVKLVVESHISVLRHRVDIRIFRHMSVTQIVDEVLGFYQYRCDWNLHEEYRTRPYTVQFRESDYDFISRLMEEEGIHYRLPDEDELLAQDDGSRVALYLADHTDAYPDLGVALPFIANHSLRIGEERVSRLTAKRAISVSQVSLRDFNENTPDIDMDVAAAGPTAVGVEHYDYPGNYRLPSEGQRLARIRAEGFACQAKMARGESDCTRLRVGLRVDVANAPAGQGGSYVVCGLAIDYHHDDHRFDISFDALTAGTLYRSPQRTPAPQLLGTLTAFVTGPDESDIHTDELGRVKIHFPWDRRQPRDDNSSDWVPVLQDNTGTSVSIPRVGWEVMVGFLEGNPDRPVVLGRVYNGADKFPELLPANKTMTALKSLSSPGRAGVNQLRLNDAAGSEQILTNAQKNQTISIANDKSAEVLNTEENFIGANETIDIGNNNSAVIGNDSELIVQGSQESSVAGSRQREVGANDSGDIAGSRFVKIGGAHIRRVGGYDTVTAGALVEVIGGLDLEASLKSNRSDANLIKTMTVGGAFIEVTAKSKSQKADGVRIETIGALVGVNAGTAITVKVGAARTSTIGGMFSAKGDDEIVIEGGASAAFTAATANLSGASAVVFKVGGSTVSFAGGNIGLNTPGDIKISGGGVMTLLAALSKSNV